VIDRERLEDDAELKELRLRFCARDGLGIARECDVWGSHVEWVGRAEVGCVDLNW
jgi:hypothetical protein